MLAQCCGYMRLGDKFQPCILRLMFIIANPTSGRLCSAWLTQQYKLEETSLNYSSEAVGELLQMRKLPSTHWTTVHELMLESCSSATEPQQ